MQTESLESLQLFLDDAIYLLPEDQKELVTSLITSTKVTPDDQGLVTETKLTDKSTAVVAFQSEGIDVPVLTTIQITGEFKKGILVIHEESTLSTEIMDMLVKMLNACGLSMSEVGLLAAENLENRTMDDFQALNAHMVLKFGRVKHPISQLPIRPYEVHGEGEVEYLYADALSSILEDKTLKRQLWGALQLLFNLGKK